MSHLDAEHQPGPWFNETRRIERDLSEMLGIAKGVLYDGFVNDAEGLAFLNWAEAHPDIVSAWPGRIIHKRLREIFADGRVTDEERRDLADLLEVLVGGRAGMIGGEDAASTLPVDDPLPVIEVPDRVFVLTGRFALGPRDACERELRKIGGWPERDVTMRTDYLVIGTFSSRDWAQTSFGRKIEKAIKYRTKRGRPFIVPEDHWAASI